MSSRINSGNNANSNDKEQSSAKSQPNSARKMYSIGRRINSAFVGRFVWHILKMDVLGSWDFCCGKDGSWKSKLKDREKH